MSNTVFKKWTDAVRYLNKKIKNNRLIAGRNIQLEDTGNGIRVNSDFEKTATDSYNGYFKVINVSTPETDTEPAAAKIKIVDGFADDPEAATTAGDALISNKSFNDIEAKEFTITGTSFIYLISTEGETEPNPPTLEVFSSKQGYELGKSKTLISRVELSDGKIKKISQEQHGPVIGYIDGDCE